MDLKDFSFQPLPEITLPVHLPFPNLPNPLGPLANLQGTWGGVGFNTIWRPNFPKNVSDRFLELNLTSESMEFDAISGPIPNRGLNQVDINMFGLTYLQKISDSNIHAGLHIEPGIWAVAPATTDPKEVATVIRMASIPHGTTMLAQGVATTTATGPTIPDNNILPFPIGGGAPFHFNEQNLSLPTPFRSPAPQLVGITQTMVNNPNSVLKAAIAGQHILSTTTLQIATKPAAPISGGGTSNTAFLTGTAPDGPNAVAADVTATFWIETVKGSPDFLQLQYSQTVNLNFNGLTWPHVSVATLKLNVPVSVPVWIIDPRLPHVLPITASGAGTEATHVVNQSEVDTVFSKPEVPAVAPAADAPKP